MTYCYAPWTNIDITEKGTLGPCCKFRHSEYNEQPLNIQSSTLEDYQNSDVLKQAKADFISGQWPLGCIRCRIEEENNIKSKRQLDLQRWKAEYATYETGYLTASIALGNTCNLACVTCNAYSSSRWQREYKELTGLDIKPIHYYRNNFVQEFVENGPKITHIDFGGGEPFLTARKQHSELLNYYIQAGKSNGMTLHYTTNGTVYPDLETWNLLDQFGSVEIQFSLDGVADRFEYIRYPAKWDQVQTVVKQYIERASTQLSVSHTVSAFNIFYLDEFLSWCKHIGLPKPWLGRVHEPSCLQPTVWNKLASQAIVEKLNSSRHFDCRIWAQLMSSNNNEELFPEFVKRVQWIDTNRQTNFAKTFPELKEYVDF